MRGWDLARFLAEVDALEAFRASGANLYERVRAHAFLAHLYRHVLPRVGGRRVERGTDVPVDGWRGLLVRQFEPALARFRARWAKRPGGLALGSALGRAHAQAGLQLLADQVRATVRARPENRWSFEHADPTSHPLRVGGELSDGARLVERTPVRMDLSHSGWSDIFFLAMDAPERARVLNVSIDLAVRGHGAPRPPVEATVRVIDRPVLRLASVDLGAEVELTRVAEVFDFACDHLGLLRAAVLAAGVVPLGIERVDAPLAPLLAALVGEGRGLELESSVLGIPKGSRLAVSTTLLCAMVAVLMRATGQTESLEGPLAERERRTVAARAILGEWLGGSGGGWQDSGGLWPGAKVLSGVVAVPGDPEYDSSRGRLLPTCEPLTLPPATVDAIAASLVLVHGGLAQDVGPILEQVTTSYLLRDADAWAARLESGRTFGELRAALEAGDVRSLARLTDAHFHGPLERMVPAATNAFTERLVAAVRAAFGDAFRGFWMLGGMSGGGMGFWFEPARRADGVTFLEEEMPRLAEELGEGTSFAIRPVVYDFAVNRTGTSATLEEVSGVVPSAAASRASIEDVRDDEALDALLAEAGFDRGAHENVRARILAGEVGLRSNRLRERVRLEDVSEDHLAPAPTADDVARGEAALAEGCVALVTLAGGAASRWSGGASVVKALYPLAKLGGAHRTFLDLHRAKVAHAVRRAGIVPLHVVTTSYRTHAALARVLEGAGDDVFLSPGRWIGLRLVPTERDLDALWRERAEQALDVQAQKVRASLRRAWLGWVREVGEATDYRDNAPRACVHPLGHGCEVPSLLANGTLARLLARRPGLTTLLLHNVDTLGADLDPGLLGVHLARGAGLTVEVTPRLVGDTGGSLALVDGAPRLVETLALHDDADELRLRFYNTLTTWIDVDALLASFGLTRDGLGDHARVLEATRAWVRRLPTYATIKEVRRRWGRGQADTFPVLQVEKLWGDATALPELEVAWVEVDRRRGMQLKEPGDVDVWRRSGGKAWLEGRVWFG